MAEYNKYFKALVKMLRLRLEAKDDAQKELYDQFIRIYKNKLKYLKKGIDNQIKL